MSCLSLCDPEPVRDASQRVPHRQSSLEASLESELWPSCGQLLPRLTAWTQLGYTLRPQGLPYFLPGERGPKLHPVPPNPDVEALTPMCLYVDTGPRQTKGKWSPQGGA